MTRWEPDARSRLEKAALELYGDRGFDQTTVAEIARRAGLTERTFFRHFADKREVLFDGSNALQTLLVEAIRTAPPELSPLDVVALGIEAAGTVFQDRREHAQRRQAVIAANEELRERELIKLASLSSAIVETLHARALPDPAASLSAEAGIAVFKIAFERWIGPDGDDQGFGQLVRASLAELKSVAAGG